MKPALLVLVTSVILTSILCAQPPKAGPALPPGSELLQAEVLKVYALDDGDTKFRAYVIKYKGNEVVVSDTLAKTDHKVGDTINYLSVKSKGNILFTTQAFFGAIKKK